MANQERGCDTLGCNQERCDMHGQPRTWMCHTWIATKNLDVTYLDCNRERGWDIHGQPRMQSMYVTSTFLLAIRVCHIHALGCNPCMSHPRSWLQSMYVTSTFLVGHVCHIHRFGCHRKTSEVCFVCPERKARPRPIKIAEEGDAPTLQRRTWHEWHRCKFLLEGHPVGFGVGLEGSGCV